MWTLGETLAELEPLMGRREANAQLAAALDAAQPVLLEQATAQLGHPVAAQALTVKILNLALARHETRIRAVKPWSRPYGLTLDTANGCTLHCPGCVHSLGAVERRLFDWPAGMLSTENARRLFAAYGPFAVQTLFCNYGEPALNPRTPDLIAMAREYLMQTMISTSLAVPRFDPGAYVRSGLDYMILSIDGATQPVYERYRRNGKLDTVLAHAAGLVEARRREGSRTPVLCWQFLAFEHNAHEIDEAVALARQVGVDEFRVTTPFEVSWDDPAIREAAGIMPGVVSLSGGDSLEALAENWGRWPARFDEEALAAALARGWRSAAAGESAAGPGPTCRWLYKNLTMDAGGRVMPCCTAPRKGEGELVFGNIAAQGDTFHSPRYREARGWFGTGGESGAARELFCVRCPWADGLADIDSAQVATYLKMAGAPWLDERAVELLSDW